MVAFKMEHDSPSRGRDSKSLYDRPVKIQLFSEKIPDWLKKAKDPGVMLIEHPDLQLVFQVR